MGCSAWLPSTAVHNRIQVLHLHAKLHRNVFIVSASGSGKPQFWANFNFSGASVPTHFYRWGQIWCAIADQWYTITCQTSFGSVYSVALWRRKTPIFAFFWTSAFSGVANWQPACRVAQLVKCLVTSGYPDGSGCGGQGFKSMWTREFLENSENKPNAHSSAHAWVKGHGSLVM